MRVIGTAGHVDHGKSTLIEALTGTHPDRLKEEQAREMTIDLGFGWLTLPDGEEIGIVDVPGHRDFVENMLAGIAGIDAALLVVAVDEGVMPQTREHLAILDLLQIPAGVIALTKTDLVADASQVEAVQASVRREVSGTALHNAPIIPVSARTRSGMADLLAALGAVLRSRPERLDLGRPRLPIDRVFSMSGFGTIVTGTLSDGALTIGDNIEVVPSGLRGRIRGLQTHRKVIDRAVPGSRTAVNITGIPAERLSRGQVLSRPGCYDATLRVDAHLRVLGDVSRNLVHNSEVKAFLGTAESVATLRLLDRAELGAGEDGWIQLELRDPLVCVRGDAFILRRPSPAETVGGGTIVDPKSPRRHRRFDKTLLASLESLAAGNPADVLLETTRALRAAPTRELVHRSHLARNPAESALHELLLEGKLIALEPGDATMDSDVLIISAPDWEALESQCVRIVSDYHERFPLRAGIPWEELKSQLDVGTRFFNAAVSRLVSQGTLRESRLTLSSSAHRIRFDERQQAAVDRLMAQFMRSPFSPPGLKDCRAAAGEETVAALIAMGALIAVSNEIVFAKNDYEAMVAQVRGNLEKKGQITLAEVRDEFRTSRKYAQALLEHLDATGMTKRLGDVRVLAGRASSGEPGGA